MNTAVIHAEGLGKRYRVGERERYVALRDILARVATAPFRLGRSSVPDHIWALRDVSFDIRQGEVVGLIGRNGSGKTTLLKLLSRITRPTAGFADIRGRVGSLLEVGTGFHPELTGRENIYLSGAVLGMKRNEINARFEEIVAFSEVERFLDTPLKHFSTGMQMRLAFAVAAHLEPEILLVDEVLAVGDIEFQKKCLGKMQEVSRSGRTIVFVSHQMNQIRRLCERVIWINSGEIWQSGPACEVIAAYEEASLRPNVASECRGQARFLRWSACGVNNVISDGLGEVTLHFHLQLPKPISQGHFGVSIMDRESAIMVGWGFDNLDLAPGTHELVLRMPMLPLRPGIYSVMCSLFNDGNNLTGGESVERWHAVPPLVVNAPPRAHPQDRFAGVLNVPAELESGQPVALGELSSESLALSVNPVGGFSKERAAGK
jgi:ABC-type polysaccharide/polyol phosphate transport system ATPase subunit